MLRTYNYTMKLLIKEQVKTLLAQEGIKLKELAEMISEKNNEKCSANSLSQKLRRGTLSYNEAIMIFELLGYEISLTRKEDK